MNNYGFDIIDGEKVPQLVITSDYDLYGMHNGTIHVEAGSLNIIGQLNGTLDVQRGSKVIIKGKQNGSISLEPFSLVIVHGEINGSTFLQQNSELIIEECGKLAGSLNNSGKIILRGVFGGAKSGNGEMIIEGNGKIKQPILKDGINYYQR